MLSWAVVLSLFYPLIDRRASPYVRTEAGRLLHCIPQFHVALGNVLRLRHKGISLLESQVVRASVL